MALFLLILIFAMKGLFRLPFFKRRPKALVLFVEILQESFILLNQSRKQDALGGIIHSSRFLVKRAVV